MVRLETIETVVSDDTAQLSESLVEHRFLEDEIYGPRRVGAPKHGGGHALDDFHAVVADQVPSISRPQHALNVGVSVLKAAQDIHAGVDARDARIAHGCVGNVFDGIVLIEGERIF